MKRKIIVHPVFIYLVFAAIILAAVGSLIIINDLTGQIIKNKPKYQAWEVEIHNNEKDCWISFKGEAYDITLFLQIYPDESLKEKCGEKVETAFFSRDDRKILGQYKIGFLEYGF